MAGEDPTTARLMLRNSSRARVTIVQMKTHALFQSGLLALASAALAFAADMPKSVSISHGDKAFVEKAAKAGSAEVAISQAALPHLKNEQVKEFASMMVTDHGAANQQLTELAAQKSISLSPKQPGTKKWDKANDKDYDADYIAKMVSEHEEAVELFTKESLKGEDSDLRAFAAKTLPTLQAHLEKARTIKQGLK